VASIGDAAGYHEIDEATDPTAVHRGGAAERYDPSGVSPSAMKIRKSAGIFLGITRVNRAKRREMDVSQIVVDPTEFAALSTMVRAVIITLAAQMDKSNPGSGRAWINALSAGCQTAVLNAAVSIGDQDKDEDKEAFKRKTVEHINRQLDLFAPLHRSSPVHH
jgi:hypothetical protein